MSSRLPIEIIGLILVRLPVRSLLRFTAVCTSWNSLIASPTFVSAHLRHGIESADRTGDRLVLFRTCTEPLTAPYSGCDQELYSLRFDREPFNQYGNIDFPFDDLCDGPLRVVGTCDGLICLAYNFDSAPYDFILWNPCIRRFLTLPIPDLSFSGTSCVGFGYDIHTNDYKVVGIEGLGFDSEVSGPNPSNVGIYSLATHKWRTSTAVPPKSTLSSSNCCAVVRGALHWYALHFFEFNHHPECSILRFNLAGEEFGEMMLPQLATADEWGAGIDVDRFWLYASVSVYKETLALINAPPASHLHVWVMKEYGIQESWTKFMRISLEHPSIGGLNGVGFLKNGGIVLEICGRLLYCSPGAPQLILLSVYGHQPFFDYYVESLLLLNKERLP